MQGDFPKLLFDHVGVAMQLAYIQNFRADVELILRFNSSPYSFGSLVVIDNHRPDTQWYKGNNYIRYTEYNHGFIRAGETGAFKMVLPWMAATDHMRLSEPTLQSAQQFYIAVMNPLRQGMDTPHPVFVQAYARFINIKAYGRRATINPGPPYTLQNDSYFINSGGSGFYTPTTGLQLQGLVLQGDIMDEAVEKSERGVISGVAEAVANVAEKAVSIPVLGTYAGAASAVARGVASVAKIFGYSKPFDVSKPIKIIHASSSHNASHGIDQSTRVFYRPEDHFGEMVAPFKRPNQETFRDIASIPVVRYNGWRIDNQTPLMLPVRPVVLKSPTDNATGGIVSGRDMILSTADIWRGAIKFRIRVDGSMLHSGRIRFAILGEDETASTEYSTFVVNEFKGSAEFEMIVPFMHPGPFLNMNVNSHKLEIMLTEVNHPENPPPPVFVHVTSECMEDIQFWREGLESMADTKVSLQGDVEEVGAKMHTARQRLDEIVSIHDILKHRHFINTVSVSPGDRVDIDALNFDGVNSAGNSWEKIIKSYKYMSGPLIYTFVPHSPDNSFSLSATESVSSAAITTVVGGHALIKNDPSWKEEHFRNVNEASITGQGVNFGYPGFSYCGPSPYLTSKNKVGVSIPSSATSSTSFDVYVSAAEDFQLGTIIPTMDGVVVV